MVMNELHFISGKKEVKDLAEKTVGWYIKKMLPRHRTLDITVKFTNCMEKNGAYGYCMQTDDDRTFEIEVDRNLRMFDLVSTLCHELTHLKQYVRKEMSYTEDGRVRWKKKVYPENFNYEDSPWEKEAFKLEKELAIECFTEVL
jgi:hypothetical protein